MSFKNSFWGGLLAYLVGKIVFVILFFIILAGIAGYLVSSINSSDKEEIISVTEATFLQITLSGEIADRADDKGIGKLINGDNGKISLEEIKEGLKLAEKDNLVKGILLDFNGLSSGIANITELRNCFIDFKKSGKKIYSYSSSYSQIDYYLASCADSVWLNPHGNTEFKGLSAKYLFFKSLLTKMGVEPEIFRQGKYKSAIEPFDSDSMSAANKEQSLALVNSIWNEMLQEISKSRKITTQKLNELADSMVILNAQQSLHEKLCDQLYYTDQVNEKIKKMSNSTRPLVAISKYLQSKKLEEFKEFEKGKNNIAILYAEGEIVDGKGGDGQIGDLTFIKELRKIREDSTIKALVLRINSPGGSALASENILREVELTKKKKTVVISMGNLAASGGYYIACKSDRIFAQPNTITGSIGVFGILFNMNDLFENKIGVHFDGVKTNEHADMASVDRKMTEKEKMIINIEIANVYKLFKQRVSEGRGMSIEMADSLGRGRVWSGIDAKKIGLVDEMGDLEDAIAFAAKKAKISDYQILQYPKQNFELSKLLKDLTNIKIENAIIAEPELKSSYASVVKLMHQMQSMKGIQTRLAGEIIIE